MPLEFDRPSIRPLAASREFEHDFALDVGPFAAAAASAAPPPKSSPKRPSPKTSPKASKISPTSRKCGASPPCKPCEAIAVVLRPLFRMVQDLKGLGRLLEVDDRVSSPGLRSG